MSIDFKNSVQTKLPRAIYIYKCVIRNTFKMRRPSDALNFG